MVFTDQDVRAMEQILFEYSRDRRSPVSNKITDDHFRVPNKLKVPNMAAGAQPALAWPITASTIIHHF
ncbi:hypothetical protein Mp_8g03770 [Marchantia polymorpha subsp. ruderalis]|uniref:Uncharacterized protein n=1 Tax=Marchantia polymorpha TaxID=3197 RepID=A0A2R6XJI4_MARPO|nr:hypothetical protein MARPO_0012s0167 [Marchantia polymorpha]BBN18593.1 hypothetical protein Mp_8g03770 [Marchantia polymorpha subsp. ruderalis]|eukprot:PTQ46239.1 hypothetical protein MARPO_0012s0167 [Marchantia polymorpha]